MIDGLWAFYEYEGLTQKIVKAIKYRFCRELVGVILEVDWEIEKPEADLIVPVPLHWYRENWRGFNQARILADEMGRRWGVEVKNVLVRLKATKPVAEMEIANRGKEVKGMFGINKNETLEGKRIILVDDVFTTGSTMREAARVLKEAGAKSVWGFVLAS